MKNSYLTFAIGFITAYFIDKYPELWYVPFSLSYGALIGCWVTSEDRSNELLNWMVAIYSFFYILVVYIEVLNIPIAIFSFLLFVLIKDFDK